MLKNLFRGLLVLAAASSTASAEIVEFRGGGFITNVTADCPPYLFDGFFFDARYRPPALGDNDSATRLGFFSTFFSQSYVLESGQLGDKYKTVQGGRTSLATKLFQAQMRVTSQTPSKIDSKTKSVYIAGQIRNFEDTSGCRVNFQVSMTRSPSYP